MSLESIRSYLPYGVKLSNSTVEKPKCHFPNLNALVEVSKGMEAVKFPPTVF